MFFFYKEKKIHTDFALNRFKRLKNLIRKTLGYNTKIVFLIDNIDNPDVHFENAIYQDRICSDISYILMYLKGTMGRLQSNNHANEYNKCIIIATCTSIQHIDPSLLLPGNAVISTIQKPSKTVRIEMLKQLVHCCNQYFHTSWILDPKSVTLQVKYHFSNY